MTVSNALAGIAVDDISSARAWYARLLDDEGAQSAADAVEWTLPRGGGLHLFEDRLRAGSSSVTLTVDDLEAQRRRLERLAIAIVAQGGSDSARTLTVHDPSDNRIVFAQAPATRPAH